MTNLEPQYHQGWGYRREPIPGLVLSYFIVTVVKTVFHPVVQAVLKLVTSLASASEDVELQV